MTIRSSGVLPANMVSNVKTAVILSAALMTLQVVGAFTLPKPKFSASGESTILENVVSRGLRARFRYSHDFIIFLCGGLGRRHCNSEEYRFTD